VSDDYKDLIMKIILHNEAVTTRETEDKRKWLLAAMPALFHFERVVFAHGLMTVPPLASTLPAGTMLFNDQLQ
jgi:hypothetical protein